MNRRTYIQIQQNIARIILYSLLLIFAALIISGITGCDDNSTAVTTVHENAVSEMQNRDGCILLELEMRQGNDTVKTYYWVSDYFKASGFLVLYNYSGFLIQIDLNALISITEKCNYCR